MAEASFEAVIPTFNNRAELGRCLDSLASQPMLERAIVCVDGSTDGTVDWLSTVRVPFELLVLEHPDRGNHGRAATRNLALPHLRASYVALIDSDMRLDGRNLEQHAALLAARRCVSVGDIRYTSGSSVWARWVASRGKNKFAAGTDVGGLYLSGANTAMPVDAFVSVDGFDPLLSAYGGEDTELGMRLAEAGLPIVFNSTALAFTEELKTVAEGLSDLRELGKYNLPRIRARHPDGPAPFWIDRYDSPRIRDRMFRALQNPLTDGVANALVPRAPWALQRPLLNYLAIRAVHSGYAEAMKG